MTFTCTFSLTEFESFYTLPLLKKHLVSESISYSWLSIFFQLGIRVQSLCKLYAAEPDQPSLAASQAGLAVNQPRLAATQPSLAAIQKSLAATQPSLAASQAGLAVTQPRLAATQPSLAPVPLYTSGESEVLTLLTHVWHIICSISQG
jgi:hypothetical protein